MKKVLFIERDGTLIKEAPPTYQIDSFCKLEFYPDMFTWMRKIAGELDFELVMVTNQDGLGTSAFPEHTFQPVNDVIMKSLANEGIHFANVYINKTFPDENAPTRKPGTGMLTNFINNPDDDLANSFVIGDRITDVQLAKNSGCKAIGLNLDKSLGGTEISDRMETLQTVVALESTSWAKIYSFLKPDHILNKMYANDK